jgi:hypothetical protein
MKTGLHGEKLVTNCLTYGMFHYYHSQDVATSPLNTMGYSLTAISGNLIIQTESGKSEGGSSSNNTDTDTLSSLKPILL